MTYRSMIIIYFLGGRNGLPYQWDHVTLYSIYYVVLCVMLCVVMWTGIICLLINNTNPSLACPLKIWVVCFAPFSSHNAELFLD